MTYTDRSADTSENSGKTRSTEIFICKGKEAYAYGKLPPAGRGFIVLAGSRVVHRTAPSLESNLNFLPYYKLRTRMIEDGTVSNFVFTRDAYFTSPSAASSVVLGKPSNGKKDWKNADGKTLGELI